jgi:molecular chaperone GrpE
MENALKFVETMSEEVRNWAMGFQMILGQFKEVLHTNGITPFASEGMRFDPSRHHAIETEESEDIPEGTILKEFVKGYTSKERTVRPARVKVAIAPSSDLNENKKENNHV